MILHVRLFAAAVRGIHEDHVKLIVLRVVQHVPQEGIIVVNLGQVDVMQQHVGDAQHIRKLLLFDAVNGIVVLLLIGRILDLGLERFQPVGDEPARAAGKICDQSNFDTKEYGQCL